MPTGPFSLLPLLDGWNYAIYTVPTTTIVKGAPQFLKRITTRGWLMDISVLCTDAYATWRMKSHGSRGKWWEISHYPEVFVTVGAVQQDPASWIKRYSRPNPFSTAGLYYLAYSAGFQGTPLPLVPDTITEGFLGDLSTETSALLSGSADVIEIVDEKAFMESYHSLMGTDLTAKAKLRLSEYLTKLKELQK